MKSLVDFIRESYEIEPAGKELGDDYRVIVLAKRYVDCRLLSKEEFCKLLSEDYDAAVKEAEPLMQKANAEKKEEVLAHFRKQAEEYAARKYKSQKKRDEAIANAEKNAEEWAAKRTDAINAFHIDLHFGARNEVASMDSNKVPVYFYDELSKEPLFKKAKGWAFKYNTKKDKFSPYFSPYIEFILDDSDAAEREANRQHLADDIKKFYSGSNYWGD